MKSSHHILAAWLFALLALFLPLSASAADAGTFHASAPATAPDAFPPGAQWIALDADSTVLFPHHHLLKRKSEAGRSLKAYALPLLTKTFTPRKAPVASARAYVCGLGHYELFVNGRKAGRHFLDPGWTMYDKTLLYNEHDVTDLLKGDGLVTLSVMLGGGMYDIPLQGYHKFAGSCGAPKLLLALHIDYADGARETIVSDGSWTAQESAVRYSSIFGGETFDATFTATPRHAVITRPHWDARLVRQDEQTRLRVKQELPMTRLAGTDIYDSRQNCSGIVRLQVKGRRGATVTMRPAEILKDGTVYQRCAPGYTWTYILRGDAGGETWQPQFTYTGFRYVEVKADGVESLALTALHTSADIPATGTFECSDTLLNRIFTLIDWAISSNLASITTDCPTREKLGWQEQNHLMAHSLMYRYDMRALMNKIADDMADSQLPSGAIPTIAPAYTNFGGNSFDDTPEWGASFILCPYYTYLWYGDDTALRRHYDAMRRYMRYLKSRTAAGILDYGLGDWYDIGPERPGFAQLTSVALSATAMYYYELNVMQQIATLTGHDADAEAFAAEAADVKRAFNARFWSPGRLCYERGSQTAQAMALFMGLADGDRSAGGSSASADDFRKERTIAKLAGDLTLLTDTAHAGEAVVTAGDVGYRYVLQALYAAGRSDLIWRMNRRDDVPGYAYQLRQGATALTESWQGYDNVSNNHFMLGHLMEWLFQGPGGIRQAEGSVAWRSIVIEPQMVGTLTWAKTTVGSPQGDIACHWTASPGRSQWTIDVTIPDGSEADIHLPDGTTRHVRAGKHKFTNP